MKEMTLETNLVAAAPGSAKTNSFVEVTMQKISKPKRWPFMQTHRLAFAMLAVLVLAVAGFSGYAYAIGSDPVSLITRLVEGDHVKVNYSGHTYQYGTGRSYSDAAITAYAELNTVRSLDNRATDAFGVPANGFEYVDDVLKSNTYIYPTIGTITAVNDGNITLTQQYTLGDKMDPSHDINTPITTPADSVKLFKNGEPVTAGQGDIGKLVAIFTHSYIKHAVGSDAIQETTMYFSFVLSHPLADFKAADDQTKPPSPDAKQTPLYEPNWGGLSTLCVNNPADTCDNEKMGHDEGQGLYAITKGTIARGGMYNESSTIWANGGQDDLLQRNLQGTIINMDDASITIRTSSGAEWKLAYSQAQHSAFDAKYAPLRVGNTIGAGVLQPVYHLSSRTADNEHVMFLMRL